MPPEGTYNGWKNYETWNVALWISNDEGLYNASKEFSNYENFAHYLLEGYGIVDTPDGVEYSNPDLDIVALDELFLEN